MINNDTLFDHFRTARKRGHRSAWSAPSQIVPQNRPVYVPSWLTEPSERITECDCLPEHRLAACVECGDVDYVDMLHDDGTTCGSCEIDKWADHMATLAAIRREEFARQ